MKIIRQISPRKAAAVRKVVLRKNIDLPSVFEGDHDPDTFHFGIFDKEQLVGVVSYMKKNLSGFSGKQYQLRGMATLDEFKHKGYGSMLLNDTEIFLKEKGTCMIWCNARVKATGFYQKLGYTLYGNKFDIPKIGGHFVMYKVL